MTRFFSPFEVKSRFVASGNVVTVVPFSVWRTSGSAATLPTRLTLLTLRMMVMGLGMTKVGPG